MSSLLDNFEKNREWFLSWRQSVSRALYREEQLIPWNNRSHASSFSRTKFRGVDVGPARLIQPLQNERRKGIVIDHSYRGRETGGTPFLVKDNIELFRFRSLFPRGFSHYASQCSILEENWLSIWNLNNDLLVRGRCTYEYRTYRVSLVYGNSSNVENIPYCETIMIFDMKFRLRENWYTEETWIDVEG